MTASVHTPRWFARVWPAVCRAAALLLAVHGEQARMWEVWWQANRATVPDSGPLTWVLTLDGYQLAGSHLPAQRGARTGGRS
jgi:hypothetical protein